MADPVYVCCRMRGVSPGGRSAQPLPPLSRHAGVIQSGATAHAGPKAAARDTARYAAVAPAEMRARVSPAREGARPPWPRREPIVNLPHFGVGLTVEGRSENAPGLGSNERPCPIPERGVTSDDSPKVNNMTTKPLKSSAAGGVRAAMWGNEIRVSSREAVALCAALLRLICPSGLGPAEGSRMADARCLDPDAKFVIARPR